MTKQQVVFFCGPDRCGKTEIATALAKRLDLPYYKAVTERGAFVNDQKRFINDIKYSCPARLDLLRQIGTGIVYDRGYPCEWVYAQLYKRETDMNAITWLDEQYAAMGAVIVIPYRSSYAGIIDDLDPKINEEMLKRLQKYYEAFACISHCKVLKLNVDDENLEREVTDIIKFLEQT